MTVYALEFTEVTMEGGASGSGLSVQSLTASHGSITVVHAAGLRSHVELLFDLAQGLQRPDRGRVKVEGVAWVDVDPRDEASKRAGIRRTWHGNRWVSNLSVLENVTLAERHWTGRSRTETEDEAGALASSVGLSCVPDVAPANVSHDVLERCDIVRALLGRARLVLLDHPEWVLNGVEKDGLCREVIRVAGSGAAVVWVTGEQQLCNCLSSSTVVTYRLDNGRLC